MKWTKCVTKTSAPFSRQDYFIIIKNDNGITRPAKFQSDNIVTVKDLSGKYTLEYTWNYLVNHKYYWRYITDNEKMAFL